MSDPGIFRGLGRSAFLADLGEPVRGSGPLVAAVGRMLASIAGGFVIGGIAATAGLILVFTIWIFATGHGSEGVRAIGSVAVAFQQADGRDLGSALLVMMVAVATNLPFALAFVALAALIAHKRFISYLTASRNVRWRLLAVGLLLSAILNALFLIAGRIGSNDTTVMPMVAVSPQIVVRGIYVVAAFVLLIPAAGAEEILFRGWMIRQIAAFTRRPAILILITAVVFSGLHITDFQHLDLGAFITRALMGAGFAYMTLRLGGVEFSTGAHAANNILIVLFAEPLTMKTLAEQSKLTVGSAFQDVAMIVGYVLITEAVVRNRALRRWAGLRIDEVSAPVMSVPG